MMNDEKAARLAAIRAANAARATATAEPTGQAGSPPAPPPPLVTAATGQAGSLPAPPPPLASVAETAVPTAPAPLARATQTAAKRAPTKPSSRTATGSGVNFEDAQPAISLLTLVLMLVGVAIGAFAAAFVLPTWLPSLSTSLLGPEPKAYWYLARSSAWVAYALLWLSMALGLMMTNKLARLWPGGPVAFELHQYSSLLGLAFALFHGLILLGDSYMHPTLLQVLLPFANTAYEPLWVGLGQVAFYLLAVVGLSFYARAWIGRYGWRVIHFLSFVVFALALAHGVWSGTDSATLWAQGLYWASGASLLFLTVYRVLMTRRGKSLPAGA